MALIGGGGAGNVAGSNPSGTSKALNYVGNHAYGYSGSVDNNGSAPGVLLEFVTGNEYVLGIADLVYFTESGTADAAYVIKLNDQPIYGLTLNGNINDSNRPEVDVLIPPYSKLTVTGQRISGSGTIALGVMITGRVYA